MDTGALNFDSEFMSLALQEAEHALGLDEVPIGAVIVKDGRVLAKDHNRRETLYDVTAHAEMLVMRAACEQLKNWRLMGCTIYVTMEPCPMCAGAMQQARVARVVYGCADPKAGAAGSTLNILDEPKLSHRLRVTRGVEEEKCRELLNIFFKRLRPAEK